MKKPWSDEEVKFLRENWGLMSRLEIAKQLNRTLPSINGQAVKLQITKPKEPSWSSEQISYLEENWGKFKMAVLAKNLERTPVAIMLKAKRLGLGPTKECQGQITANQIAKALGVEVKTVTEYWITKCGLKARRKVTKISQRFWQIDIKNFWNWAKDNQDKFDSRRFEYLCLGVEPEWMKDKRRSDMELPPRRLQKWTKAEDDTLKALFKAGFSYQEIGQRLGRSKDAVGHRLTRIDIWGIAKRVV